MKIKFKTGPAVTVSEIAVNIKKIKSELAKVSGLNFGKGDLVSQIIGTLYATMHNPEQKKIDKDDVLANTVIGLCQAFADKYDAGLYVVEETRETLVLIESPKKNHANVMRIEKNFQKWLRSGNWDFQKSIEPVTIIEHEVGATTKKVKPANKKAPAKKKGTRK